MGPEGQSRLKGQSAPLFRPGLGLGGQLVDVAGHRSQSSSRRLVPVEPRPVQGQSGPCGQHRGTVSLTALLILVELDVADPVPRFPCASGLWSVAAGLQALLADLAVLAPDASFLRPGNVGSLFHGLPTNGFRTWSASAWSGRPPVPWAKALAERRACGSGRCPCQTPPQVAWI